ncbi:MAG TPA: hypothetical protein VNU92_05395 [Edaphobacter sp.]|nr:hypothetical protein [Edaphobacter sp.]
METQKQILILRHHLLDMSKLTHRAVDYAIKGYRLGSPEFCRFVRRSDLQLGELRRRVNALCRRILMKDVVDPQSLMNEMVTDPDVRFTISALLICDALHATCTAAFEIAHHTMMLIESACSPACEALERLCYLANRMMCLSIVALFKNQNHHAETVLQNHEVIARLAGQAASDLRSDATRRTAIPAALQLAITNSLSQIARQAYTIAEATVYWLAGHRNALQPGAFPRLQPSTTQ